MSKEFKDYQDAKSRVLEAKRLLALIVVNELNTKDSRFVFSIERKLASEFAVIDAKVIYWLRDIKDRQLEG